MRTRAGVKSGARPLPHSVKDLLARQVPALARLSDQAARQGLWNQWLSGHLDAQMHARVTGITERDGVLVVFAESAAWSARLRFALHELEGALRSAHPQVTAINVRVLPRS